MGILLEEVQLKKIYAPKHLKVKSILNKEIVTFCYMYDKSLYAWLFRFLDIYLDFLIILISRI